MDRHNLPAAAAEADMPARNREIRCPERGGGTEPLTEREARS